MEYYKNLQIENLLNEIWVNVYGYDGYYSVSNLGRMRSEYRYAASRYGLRKIRKRILKQHISYAGVDKWSSLKKYRSKSLMVSFSINTIKTCHHVSVLVGSSFIRPLRNKKECFSKQNKKWNDNTLINLKVSSISNSCILSHKMKLKTEVQKGMV